MRKIPIVIVWAVAFAFVESAVVEYLRALYFPLEQGGFRFPLQTMDQLYAMGEDHVRRLFIELGRECATLVMLATLGMIAGRNRREAWAYFMIAFGVWDIFYYVWLRVFLGWPESLMTRDLLFLVPVPWVAPVLAPVIISTCLIVSGILVLIFEQMNRPLSPAWSHWALISAGGIVVIFSFCLDAGKILAGGLPGDFNWALFGIGLGVSALTFSRLVYDGIRAGFQ
jgi:hypothetical protein